MPKDFASQARNKPTRKRTPKTRQKRIRRSDRGPIFHGPSFSIGAIIGATIVAIMAYTPELLIETSANLSETNEPRRESEQMIEITFPQLLRESEVSTDTSNYQITQKQNNSLLNSDEIFYQAASFRNLEDAEKLRARLLLNNFDANIKVKNLNQIDWHRVVVGPFRNADHAMSARSKLNELNIPVITVQHEN